MKLRNVQLTGKFNLRRDSLPAPTFEITKSAGTANEGQTITITVNTTHIPDGTMLPYEITGITANDLVSGSLTGFFTIQNGTASQVLSLVNDNLYEGDEVATVTLNSTPPAMTQFTIVDTSYPVSYELVRSAASANEGTSFSVTLNTAGVPNGTQVPYTITGVSAADLASGSLSGYFTVSGNLGSATATQTFDLVADHMTEGTETFSISLVNGMASTTVQIGDTSNVPTYQLSHSAATVDEGTSFTVTLTTAGVTPTTQIPYTITGVTSSDINNAPLTGVFTVTGTTMSGTASITVVVTADYTTEGSEIFTLSLDGLSQTTSVTINDTSVTMVDLNTMLLANFDGSVVTDGSAYSRAVTTTGTHSFVAGAFSGTGTDKAYKTAGISSPTYVEYEWGSASSLVSFLNQATWTIELFVKLSNVRSTQGLFNVGRHDAAGYHLFSLIYNNSGAQLYSSVAGGGWYVFPALPPLSVNVWHHIVLMKGHALAPTGVVVMVDGQYKIKGLEGSATFYNPAYHSKVTIGSYTIFPSDQAAFDGVRFSNGIRYTGTSYTVPTTSYI